MRDALKHLVHTCRGGTTPDCPILEALEVGPSGKRMSTMTEGTTTHIDPICQMTVEPDTAAAHVRHEDVD